MKLQFGFVADPYIRPATYIKIRDLPPDGEPWDTLRQLFEGGKTQVVASVILNHLFAEQRCALAISENTLTTMIARLKHQRDYLVADEWKLILDSLVRAKILTELTPRVAAADGKRGEAAVYGLGAQVSALWDAYIGHQIREDLESEARSFIEHRKAQKKDNLPATNPATAPRTPTPTDPPTDPATKPNSKPCFTTEKDGSEIELLRTNPPTNLPANRLSVSVSGSVSGSLLPPKTLSGKDLVARMAVGLPERKNWQVRAEALDRFISAFQAEGFTSSDWTGSISSALSAVFLPPKKPKSMANDTWLSWKHSVESEVETARGKMLGALPDAIEPEVDLMHEQIKELYAEAEAKALIRFEAIKKARQSGEKK